ncbi:MAG: SCO family protein [Bacteroidetes bacterium]|nr:MAG: SCO family protein [Bacteroidota bacterium]
MTRTFWMLTAIALVWASCTRHEEPLPILGEKIIENGDTIYHTIPDFAFIDQDSQIVTNETFKGKIYVADFFFISCPTICPKVTKQMLRIYKHFEDDDRVALLAHTIDVKHDTIPRLKDYATKLGVRSDKWHFVTGDKDAIYDIADDYFSIAIEDPDAPGGFDHSGKIILVDDKRRVRSFADGTDPESVDRLIADMEKLLRMEYSEER